MANYCYLRVSTLEQNTEKNKLEVLKFVKTKNLGSIDFVEEQISGKANFKDRKLGTLLDKLQKDDVLIVPELSRIARSITQILEVIEITKTKGIVLYSLKENFCNKEDNIASTVATTIFALVAQIERDLISLRTKEALQVKKEKGVKLGRPHGKGKSKLDEYKVDILKLIELRVPKTIIAKQYHTTTTNLYKYLKFVQI